MAKHVRGNWARQTLRKVSAWREDDGQGLAEYALILAFVAIACVTALGALGTAIASSPGFSQLPGSL